MITPQALACSICLLLGAGCGASESSGKDTVTEKLPQAIAPLEPAEAKPETVENKPSPVQAAAPLSNSRYTSLDPATCKLVEDNEHEAGSSRRRCAGSFGYALETTESDLRQNIELIAPDGRRSDLNLSSLVADGAFNRLGTLAEWRSRPAGQPGALIVRLNVEGDRSSERPKLSNLLVVRLAAPSCVVAVIARGPRQTEKARAVADGELPPCVKQ